MTTNRRQLIKTILTSGTAFGIFSLMPEEARAKGSWTNQNPNTRPLPAPTGAFQGRQRYIIPFSNDWRQNYNNNKGNR